MRINAKQIKYSKKKVRINERTVNDGRWIKAVIIRINAEQIKYSKKGEN